MGIFDDVVTNVRSTAQTVGKVAGQFVDMSKLRLNLAELNSEINKRYQELGQFIYETKKAGCCEDTELSDKIAALDELYAQFSTVSAQLAALQNKVTCPACGKQVDVDSMFCSHCGMKLNEANVATNAQETVEVEAEEVTVEAEPETAETTEEAASEE